MQPHGTNETHGNPQVIIYQRTPVRKIQPRQAGNTAFSDLIQFAKSHGFADTEILVFIEEIGSGAFANLLDAIATGTVTTIIAKSAWHLCKEATAIQLAKFLQLCSQYRVTVITPGATFAFTTGQEIEQFRFQCQGAADYIATHIHHVMRARRRARGQEKRQ